MSTHRNRVQMTVSGTPGTGTITLNAASSGYQSFATAYGGNATVDILITEGTAWEVARDCAYTNSGTTVTRGTLEASSTGSAVSFTSAAVVSVIATADRGRTWDAASLNTQATGTDADTTMAINTLYVVDMSAWATADRTYTLPATAAVGDRIGVMVTAGNASYELLLTAGTGDTLNGISGGTEWSRVFITNEVVIMRCVVANATWIVEYDGRIPQQCGCRLTTAATGETAATVTTPTDKSGAWTAYANNASLASVSTGDIKTRRAGNFHVSYAGVSTDTVTSGKYFSTYLYLNGNTTIAAASQFAQNQSTLGRASQQSILTNLAADDFIRFRWRSEEGSKGLDASPSPGLATAFSLMEVL